jgi:hypothetical protein
MKKNKFEKGDIVVCVEPIDEMVLHQRYEITGHDGGDQVGIVGVYGGSVGWHERRFVMEESWEVEQLLREYDESDREI